jgi:hypothetical protein
MSPYGPRLTTWALQQTVSFLGYTRYSANVAAMAESDPKATFVFTPVRVSLGAIGEPDTTSRSTRPFGACSMLTRMRE